jgi:hypothetical protein
MSNFKLYMGGFRNIQGVVIAEDKEEAEAKLYDRLSLGSLPCELEEVETYGYEIVERRIVPLEAPKSVILTKPKPKE